MMGTSPAQRLRLQAVAAEYLERMGRRIRERRESLGLSRTDVAREMPGKVGENQVYRWEKGLHQPNPDTLQALAVALKCEVADFMAPDAPENEGGTPDPFASSAAEGGDLAQLVAGLDEQVRLLRSELAARDAEVLTRIAGLQRSIQDLRDGPQP